MPKLNRKLSCVHLFALSLALFVCGPARGQAPPPGPIRISVDASHARQKILHARLEIPASPGPLTLYYSKWLPADHSPDGPIANVAGLKFFAGGKPIPWRQDLDDMYTFHVNVPAGEHSVTVHLDFLLSAPGPTIDFAAAGSSRLLILMWNEVLLYPKGWPVHELTYVPTLRLPAGWKFHTSLPIASRAGETIHFAPVPLDLLVDSPVQSGEYTRVIPLAPGQTPPEELDVVADDAWALEIPPELIGHYRKLVAEARALYQSYHYRDYHFLLTLSDNVLPLGQEHHESSDDRVAERTLTDPATRLLGAGLFPHEFTHSWNGQYRRPKGLATPDFQQPMRGTLLWVYEGLTTYLGTVLTARSGLWTPAETRDDLAMTASMLNHRAGRTWRSLQNTSDAAQILYFAPPEWKSYRRGTDFYTESVLLWLGVDVKIRELTADRRSLDDFCRLFFAGENGKPVIKTYTFDDLLAALNRIAPYDWRSYLRERLDSVSPHAPMDGVTGGGWRLVYNDQPNRMLAARRESSGTGDFTTSLGLVVRSNGAIVDVIPGMPAFAAGLSPYMRIVGVNGRKFSVPELTRAIEQSKAGASPIAILASNTGTLKTHEIAYHGGMKYPHLARLAGKPDYLGEILRPLTGAGSGKP
jgi:predicted metalloprotease with PDZ domain